jgi:tetrapyrrole methylase family protein/MazG family protein
VQERAAAVGFDWPDVRGPLAKMRGELAEVEQELARQAVEATDAESVDPNTPRAAPSDRVIDEIGDLLFTVVNLSRKAGVEPGIALDRATRKFRQRFEQLEALAEARGIDLAGAGLERLDALWDEVKGGEEGSDGLAS